ncbi:MAG: hypothetical protein GY894_01240 [Planctomycetes bacterium]|nr:hypothetical protein [Planctomycetota bacterium]MCP4837974.1 hypothetical protein [Planctomycetota bacterium]
MKRSLRTILGLLAVLAGGYVDAGTLRVPGDATSIQHAIDLAQIGDVVEVGPGVWHEAIDLRGKSILLRGCDGAETTIIDATDHGESVVRCMSGEGPGTVIERLTLTGGTGHEGLYGSGTSIGGGLLAIGASPTVRDCVFKSNSVSRNGGGAYCGKGGNVRFERCRFEANTAEKGAGILCVGSTPVLDRCVFQDNTARYSGGGLYAAKGSSPIMRECQFIRNQASFQGGGVCSLDSAGEVLGGIFERNRAGSHGGAVYLGFRTTLQAAACQFVSPTDTIDGTSTIARSNLRRGACDLSEDVTVLAEEYDCVSAGGEYRGDGTRCPSPSKDQLARRRGDLNRDGRVSRRDLAIMMLLWR